jgi:uncharacterized protein (UPF0332 family)
MNSAIASYMSLAEQCIQDARSLYKNGSYRSAANRAYYAYFDAVRALLVSKNVIIKSHSAIRALFGEHFVKEGPFEKQDAKNFHELFLLRQHSDYEIDEDIPSSDVFEAIELAAEFLIQTEAYLRENQFTS